MKYNNFLDAWHFLNDHPVFKEEFQYGCLDIHATKVNPETKAIDDNEALNTEVNVWLECGPIEDGFKVHDIDLDCGAETFEKAIVELAALVLKKYGDYEEPEITEEEQKRIDAFFDAITKNSK